MNSQRVAVGKVIGLLLVVLSCLELVVALSPISIKGTKLYDDDGKQFFVKGVVYADLNTKSDVLLNSDQCQLDAGLIKQLGANTVRVSNVDGSQNHDDCMNTFSSHGIYVWLDLFNQQHIFNATDLRWNRSMYSNWTKTLEAFAKYDNLLSVSIGDEIWSGQEPGSVQAAPYIKAAARDVKAYRNARNLRSIPISYLTSDLGANDIVLADYLACGSTNATIDMFGLNIFSWCGNSDYYKSAWSSRYQEFQHLNIPTVFTELGCEIPDQAREFGDVAAMLGSVFPNVFSGAIVYEWPQQKNGYGIVTYPNGDYSGFPSTLDDFNKLSTIFSTAQPTGTSRTSYTPSNSIPSCPTENSSKGWPINGPKQPLPTIVGLNVATVSPISTSPASTSGTSGSSSGGGNGTDGHSGLSGGAIAGIVIGSIAAIAMVAAALFFLLRHRRRRANVATEPTVHDRAAGQPTPSSSNPTPHSEGTEKPEEADRSELQAVSVGRILPRQELDSHAYSNGGAEGGQEQYGPVHELDASSHDHYQAAR